MKASQWHTRGLLVCAAMGLLITEGGCTKASGYGPVEPESASAQSAPSKAGESQDPASIPFRHELAGLKPVNGKYPIVDIQDSPSGQRYSMEVGASQACETCPVERFEGVLERTMTQRPGATRRHPEIHAPAPIVEAVVEQAMARAPQARHEVELIFRTNVLNVTRELEWQVATGMVQTSDALREARRQIVVRRTEALRAFMAEKKAEVEAAGGRVLRTLPALGRLHAEVTPAQVERLLPGLRRVAEAKADHGTTDGADMIYIREGHQLDQLINNGFEGERYAGTSDDYHIAFWESGLDAPADMEMHYDTSSLLTNRLQSTWCPSGSVCNVVNSASQHPNRVLSVAIGDLTQGQDPGVTGTTDRINKSGVALEAKATQYVGGWSGAANQMLIDASNFEVAVVNTAGSATGSPTCQGNDADAIAADTLYEAGVFVVGGAGNDGDSTECNVTQPKDAIGVFTTAGSDEISNTTDGVRNGTFHASSSVGGVEGAFSNSGRGRTIIDMTLNFGFTDRPNWDGTLYGSSVGGNSLTGPAMAAAAINFSDWFETGHGSTALIGNPGKLFAAMLLMGDRQKESGKFRTEFGRRWGAGRLKMRKLDTEGLDGPWQWGMATVCVGDGETVYYDLTAGLATSTDYDFIKGVLFWYDNRLENSVPINNLDLILQNSPDGIVWTDHRSSASPTDNKERVVASDTYDGEIGQQYWRWKIVGTSVDETAAGDPAGCVASGEQRAHIFWLVEDSDRDDADGPAEAEIEKEG